MIVSIQNGFDFRDATCGNFDGQDECGWINARDGGGITAAAAATAVAVTFQRKNVIFVVRIADIGIHDERDYTVCGSFFLGGGIDNETNATILVRRRR